MADSLPKLIMLRYASLWQKLGSKSFTYHQAVTVLKKDTMVSIALSELRRSGWLTLALDPHDARKRIYTLKSPEEMVREIAEQR